MRPPAEVVVPLSARDFWETDFHEMVTGQGSDLGSISPPLPHLVLEQLIALLEEVAEQTIICACCLGA